MDDDPNLSVLVILTVTSVVALGALLVSALVTRSNPNYMTDLEQSAAIIRIEQKLDTLLEKQ